MKTVIEMRTYRMRPGKRAQFLEIFVNRAMPLHRQIGMKIIGPMLSLEDPDVLFFMRAFPDRSLRDPMKAQFYEGPLWKDELEQIVMPLIEKFDVVLVEDSEGLFPRWES
jgi:hypothetical protein